MIGSNFIRRTVLAGIVLASLPVGAACSDSDPLNPDPHADVHQTIVQVEGGMQITFNRADVASGPLTLGNNNVVTLSFLGPDGLDEENANNTERFDLRVSFPNGNPAGLVFTPSASDEFSGTFTRTSPTSSPMIVQFELWHASAAEPHSDGKWNAQVHVQ